MLLPSEFATPTPALDALAKELDVRRRDVADGAPATEREQMFNHFECVPKSAKADSPIDLALLTHAGIVRGLPRIS